LANVFTEKSFYNEKFVIFSKIKIGISSLRSPVIIGFLKKNKSIVPHKLSPFIANPFEASHQLAY
jgi:hypothetical protein